MHAMTVFLARPRIAQASIKRLLCFGALLVAGDGLAAECATQDDAAWVSTNLVVTRICIGREQDTVATVATVQIADRQFDFIVSAGDTSGGFEYLARTTSDFASELDLDIAVNGGFFTPFNPGTYGMSAYPAPGNPVQVIGLSVSRATWYSLPETSGSDTAKRVNGALCIAGAVIQIVDSDCDETVDYGIGAGPILVFDGAARSFDNPGDFYQEPAPRTAIAINHDASVLWLVVVDGRQIGHSVGVDLTSLAAFLHELGADRAINLDGGGSSVMVGREGRLLSRPIHLGITGRERPVANHFGIRERARH